MNFLQVIGNYVILTRNSGGPNEIIKEFAQKETLYNHNEASNEIFLKGSRNSDTITEDEITAGDWSDVGGVLDLAGVLLFLRENTANFKTASGGSGAGTGLIFTLDQNGGAGVPDINIVENSTGLTLTIIKIGVGTFDLSLDDAFDFIPTGFGSNSQTVGDTLRKSAIWGENLIFQSSPTPPYTTWDIQSSIQFSFSNNVLRLVSNAGSDKIFTVPADGVFDGTQIFQILLPSINY